MYKQSRVNKDRDCYDGELAQGSLTLKAEYEVAVTVILKGSEFHAAMALGGKKLKTAGVG